MAPLAGFQDVTHEPLIARRLKHPVFFFVRPSKTDVVAAAPIHKSGSAG